MQHHITHSKMLGHCQVDRDCETLLPERSPPSLLKHLLWLSTVFQHAAEDSERMLEAFYLLKVFFLLLAHLFLFTSVQMNSPAGAHRDFSTGSAVQSLPWRVSGQCLLLGISYLRGQPCQPGQFIPTSELPINMSLNFL